MNNKILKKAFETGYTDEQYEKALKEFFAVKEAYEKDWELIDYKDSIFSFESKEK